ncbi:MAG TPA: hypothetical protein VK571_07600, partial [Gemmatimonadaceae bacterium]|nr:hypothetical protein [Gemmatimonadaceae bacterium]
KGTPEEALGNAQQHYAQLRTGLEQIADKHATRLPALFHPDPRTVEKEKAAGRPAADTIPMNVYFWKDATDGKFHLYDLTTPSRPHEQTIDGQPTAAMMNTFFEDVARYPEGEVRYSSPAAPRASPRRPASSSGSIPPMPRIPSLRMALRISPSRGRSSTAPRTSNSGRASRCSVATRTSLPTTPAGRGGCSRPMAS